MKRISPRRGRKQNDKNAEKSSHYRIRPAPVCATARGIKERPILFSGEMVKAILDGRKTQTRRIFAPEMIKIEPHPKCGLYYKTYATRNGDIVLTGGGPFIPKNWLCYCPFGQPGDRLWVRETFYIDHWGYQGKLTGLPPLGEEDKWMLYYAADGDVCRQIPECDCSDGPPKLHPSLHMPRWASRITLEITDIRVERLQDISGEDAKAEGWPRERELFPNINPDSKAKDWYLRLWESINGKGSWVKNPWVWVITFRKV